MIVGKVYGVRELVNKDGVVIARKVYRSTGREIDAMLSGPFPEEDEKKARRRKRKQ